MTAFLPCFMFSLSLFSQGAETVSLITYWSKGDVFRYEQIKGKKSYRNDVLMDSTARTSIFTLTVIDSTKDDYLIEIGYQTCDMDLIDKLGLSADEIARLDRNYGDFKPVYRIDALGSFLGIEKPEIIQDFSKEFSELLLKHLAVPKSKLSPELWRVIEIQLSPQVLVAKIFEDLQIIHSFYGEGWYVDSLMVYNDSLSNMMGGPPIPVQSEVAFSWYDDDLVSVIYKNFVSEEHFSNVMTETLGKEEFKKLPSEVVLTASKGSMEEICQAFLEPATGIIYGYFRDKTVAMKTGYKTIEFTEIRQVD